MNATIDLASAQRPAGLIVLAPTGVRYTNQVGGTCCHHPSAEGLFVPLEDHDDWSEELCRLTCDYSFGDIPEDRIDTINGTLYEHGLPLQIDLARWDESAEAWLFVEVTGDRTLETIMGSARRSWGGRTDWQGLAGAKAVLTWLNSD